MKIYTPKRLRAKLKGKKWVMSYNELFAVVDPKASKVMYIENYGPEPGFFIEGWRAFHFPRTSSLVEKSYREGNYTIYILRQGKANLNLVPSFAPIGIEECVVKGDKVFITLAGFGGGGVSASFSRGMARGVLEVRIIQEGGGERLGKAQVVLPLKRMLLVGVDDTDNEKEGATYSLVHNISMDLAGKLAVWYAIHGNVQLYPHNPYKTKNCMGTVVGFIFDDDEQKKGLIGGLKESLKRHTLSEHTGMAVFEGFSFSKEFLKFSHGLKFRLLKDIKPLYKVCGEQGVELYKITGERGLIGAVSSLGFFDQPDFGAQLPGNVPN